MSDEALLVAAVQDRDIDLVRLRGLTEEELKYLASVGERPDLDDDGEFEQEHDQEPHLTDEEWAFVLAVADHG